ncbi:hypothetical protein DPMN_074386 [Dreissena polymorpha]|uniref:Uncharacterized protein n=1 Tax=Dreissena polymorpha TaxID=45954 RepID=A0A9D3YJ48_DREPO|nr:hypothetical protein DPMN_074386 [Dreissena polymorpha]
MIGNTSALTKYVIAGVSSAIVIVFLAACVTSRRASAKLLDLEKRYVAALDQGYIPPDEPPEISCVFMDVVRTTFCCSKSAYPASYLPSGAFKEEHAPLIQEKTHKNKRSVLKSESNRNANRHVKRSKTKNESRGIIRHFGSAKSVPRPLTSDTRRSSSTARLPRSAAGYNDRHHSLSIHNPPN